MAKNNPLFVDSTLLHGDRIGTQIELNQVMVYEGESVSVLIINHLGESRQVPLKANDEGGFQARVFLSHQKVITYRFLLERDGKVFLQSTAKQLRVQYAIIEDWSPAQSGEEVPSAVLSEPKPVAKRPLLEKPFKSEYTKDVVALIEKWGL